jgi:hypothetical protein
VGPGANVTKLFTAVIYGYRNKLECLSLASLSSLVYFMWARPGAYPRVEHLKDASLGQVSGLTHRH